MPIDLLELPMPVTLRPHAPISDEELMRFSEENKPYRIERNRHGEILIMTPVGFLGGTHEGFVSSALIQWAEQDGRGTAVGANIGFNLPDGSCLAPDAAWVSQSRLEQLTPKQKAGYPPLCPDFLIEVRSQTDSRRSVEEKMQLWLDNGAKLAWLIDPVDATVTVYRPGGETRTLNRPQTVQGESDVAGFILPCDRLWPRL